MTKHFGYGAVLQVTTTTGDAAIGQVLSITGPGVDFPDVDTTTMDSSSNYRTFVPGLGDPGELTINVLYDPAAVAHKRLAYYMGQRSPTSRAPPHKGLTHGKVIRLSVDYRNEHRRDCTAYWHHRARRRFRGRRYHHDGFIVQLSHVCPWNR